MNLLITTDCNLACPYCFAASLRTQGAAREMTLPEINQAVANLNPLQDPVRLMGGEPTLHSRYAEILSSLKTKGFQVVVFTNGICESLRRTAPCLPDRVLVNVNDRDSYASGQRAELRKNLCALGNRAELGYTITRQDFDLGWHRQLILEEGCRPVVRLGLAQPVAGGDNAYLDDQDLPAAHASLALWATRLMADGIRLGMDCGFMRCLFSDQDIEALIRAGTALRFECSPTIDLGPGLQAWRCYAFSNQKGASWSDFPDEVACRDWFTGQDPVLPVQCAACQFLIEGWCQGGCRARVCHQEELLL